MYMYRKTNPPVHYHLQGLWILVNPTVIHYNNRIGEWKLIHLRQESIDEGVEIVIVE